MEEKRTLFLSFIILSLLVLEYLIWANLGEYPSDYRVIKLIAGYGLQNQSFCSEHINYAIKSFPN
jgi:hypothetical protein